MLRIPYDTITDTLSAILGSFGFTPERADLSARLFADSDRDGVSSHGLARFPRYVAALEDGVINPTAEPVRTWSAGAIERWDGRSGPGNLNAYAAMGRAIDIAKKQGLGCVALSQTNHWMRGGNYGWQAVDAGCIGMCWTNTMPNLPPWGTDRPLIGNNPLIIAVPRAEGAVVLDMAMSQFSYGVLERYATEHKELPVPGGFDSDGELTTDAAAIEESVRPLPVGYWKGTGLSILLDLTAALLSGGRPTMEIEPDPARETGLSQVFIAFAPPAHPGLADTVIAWLAENGATHYPGKTALTMRKDCGHNGVPVSEATWDAILDVQKRAASGNES